MNTILELDKLVGIRFSLSDSKLKNKKLVLDFWKFFNKELYFIGYKKEIKTTWVKYAITIKSGAGWYYIIAVPYADEYKIVNKFEIIQFEKLVVKKYEQKGSLSLILDTITRCYNDIKSKKEIEKTITQKTNIVMIEEYDSNFNWNENNSIIKLYFPL